MQGLLVVVYTKEAALDCGWDGKWFSTIIQYCYMEGISGFAILAYKVFPVDDKMQKVTRKAEKRSSQFWITCVWDLCECRQSLLTELFGDIFVNPRSIH